MTAPAASLRGHAAPRDRSLVARAFLGSTADPAWVRPAFWGLLVATGLLYLVGLSASGNANTFYAAAVQAGSKSWKALFFGSLDSSNFITVDKPPASLWVMGISARIFGFNSWALLAPQALEGVATVALVWAIVRRSLAGLGARLSAVGALVAGLALACTPAAALMFRFDNPDALLVLLMTLAAYFVVRALPKASWKWLALAGVVLGFAFLTKMLQGLLVAPAFVIVYLLAAPIGIGKRLLHVLGAIVGVVVGAGWWVAIVALWPADSRPYIGGSTNNSVLELAFGYNGLGRFFGSGSGNGGGTAGGGTGGTAGGSFGGATGLNRLFSSEMGLEISWLLPAALLLLVLGLIVAGRRPRLDPLRAGLVLWGGWLVVTGLVFSYTSGTIHPYYTVALAPAIAGLVGTGGALLWRMRATWIARAGIAVAVAGTGAWSFHLLATNASYLPWLRWVVLVGSIASAVLFMLASVAAWRRMTMAAVLAGVIFAFSGSGAYAIATASVAHSGSIPTVGSSSTTSGFGGGGGGFGGGTPPSGSGGSGTAGSGASSDSSDSTGAPTGEMPSGGEAPSGAMPEGGFGGTAPGASTDSGAAEGGSSSGSAGSSGGSASSSTSSSALDALLAKSTARWAAAIDNDQSAATLELSSGMAVMAIGGWSDDPTPTLAEFKAYVAAGDIGYYIVSGSGMGGGGSSSTASAIATWVEANYSSTTVGGYTVYDLSS